MVPYGTRAAQPGCRHGVFGLFGRGSSFSGSRRFSYRQEFRYVSFPISAILKRHSGDIPPYVFPISGLLKTHIGDIPSCVFPHFRKFSRYGKVITAIWERHRAGISAYVFFNIPHMEFPYRGMGEPYWRYLAHISPILPILAPLSAIFRVMSFSIARLLKSNISVMEKTQTGYSGLLLFHCLLIEIPYRPILERHGADFALCLSPYPRY